MDKLSPKATPQEACREFANNVGETNPEAAWILTNYDTWEKNPHYIGPPVPHPEEDFDAYLDSEEYTPPNAEDEV
jgi:hypothetical protein